MRNLDCWGGPETREGGPEGEQRTTWLKGSPRSTNSMSRGKRVSGRGGRGGRGGGKPD